jgi:hypothetical protein
MVLFQTPTNGAIFRIQALVCKYTRSYFDGRSFIEIRATESQPFAAEGVQSGLLPAGGVPCAESGINEGDMYFGGF